MEEQACLQQIAGRFAFEMPYRVAIFPFFVFALAATGSLLVWLTMPADLAVEVGVHAFADTHKVIGAYMLAIVSFASGCALAYRSHDAQFGILTSPQAASKWAKVLLLIGYFFWGVLLLFSLSQGGIDFIINALTGRGKFPSIPGVTTLVHASTAAAALVAALWVIRGQKSSVHLGLSHLAVAAILLCLMRAFVGKRAHVAAFRKAIL